MAGANLHRHRIVPTAICQNQLSTPAFGALLQEPAPTVNPTSGPLVFLTPLQDPHFLPKFTVSELTLFAADPKVIINNTNWACPHGHHTWWTHPNAAPCSSANSPIGLEALSLRPDSDLLVLAERLLSTSALPVEE